MQTSFWRKELLLYVSTVLIVVLVLACTMWNVPGFTFNLPRDYALDTLFSSMTVKSIIDTGWAIQNSYLSAPGILDLGDFPQIDMASFAIIKFFTLFSHQYPVVLNLFYFSTYFLNALISLFAFRQLGLTRLYALSAALLFNFIPYHIFRNEGHLFLNAIYVIPIYVLFVFAVFNYKFSLFKNKFLKYGFVIAAGIFAASSGVYYAFFACYFLVLAGIFASINLRSWMPFLKSFLFISLISITVLVNLMPTIKEKAQYGENTQVAHRRPYESEFAALKIVQMIMPTESHRVGFMRKMTSNYNKTAPLVSENVTAALGIIGVIGFFYLLSLLFLRWKYIENETLAILSQLNISAVLLGTLGGLGSFVAYTVAPAIRSYNRISVFISFFAICGFFLMLQKYRPQWVLKKSTYIFVVAVFLTLGLLDEIPANINPNYSEIKAAFNNDEKFVNEIEKRLPANSMVFQLPVSGFPEYPKIAQMLDYENFRGYLHSKHLRWSFGAMTGRHVFMWQQAVSQKPVNEMLNDLIYAGFAGVYINRMGYQDNAAAIEKQLATILKQKPWVSDDNKLSFFDLTAYKKNLVSKEGVEAWQKHVAQMQILLKIDYWTNWKGFQSVKLADSVSAVGKKNSSIRIINTEKNSIPILIRMDLSANNTAINNVQIKGDLLQKNININSKQTIATQLNLSPGLHYIIFNTDAADKKMGALKINHFTIEPV